jgi:L-fuconolactonase
MQRIDSHQHVWRLSRGDYGWLTPDLGPLYRDVEPAELAPLLARHGISGTVLVQAAETEAETRFLLELAESTPFVRAVVGWTDLEDPDAPCRIATLAQHPRLKGLRPMLQDLDDDGFILRDAVQPALAAMQHHGLRLDALVRPRHLPAIARLRAGHPGLSIVIDHAAKPDIAGGDFAGWRADLAKVAADGLTCCKLSGLITEAGPGWSVERLRPVADTVLDLFGPERVMWGSDWPVLTLAASYDAWVSATDLLLASLDAASRDAILGGTAARFYGLED